MRWSLTTKQGRTNSHVAAALHPGRSRERGQRVTAVGEHKLAVGGMLVRVAAPVVAGQRPPTGYTCRSACSTAPPSTSPQRWPGEELL